MFDSFFSKTPSFNQHTLKDSFTFVGRGLHSGLKVVMAVLPGEPNTGYQFIRRDVLVSRGNIEARWNTVIDTHLSTTIANNYGVRVSTVEHLLAALHACGIDNAHIVLDAPEVPIIDGSSEAFVSLIEKIGKREQNAPRKALVIRKPVIVGEENRFAAFSVASKPHISVEVNFESAAIGRQKISLPMNRENFVKEIASARTFGFKDQLSTLKKLGFARGGSMQNAVLVDGDEVVNKEGLRYPDEFVRHKYLDTVGDLSLAGATVIGEFTSQSSGHELNNLLLRELMLNEDTWVYTTLEDATKNWARLISSPRMTKVSDR